MASNQKKGKQGGTPEQHAEAGRQSHKNDANKQSGSGSGSRSGSSGSSASRSGAQEENLELGRQGGNKQSGAGAGSRSGSGGGTRGGTPEQHAAAGRQSHKNDAKK
ncbi:MULTISPECIES: hypothetical protein [unclassified Massilia]|uniref:hypothetical protein n=1 Tax=unclassified Massilia TaxID=2609279 RepID=UPI001780287F|nr:MULTISPECIES: hypothetical protein [unclassified Massilia]MBD8530178.1 hypothetical protein [Massilia sp. CFBP 13647]MBD8673993.1 hypothetical protein [Massilia sp. CFBP 13721]